MESEAINERIKKRRTELGLTLLEIAEYLGVKEATVQRYESGVIKSISHKTIGKLAKILMCSPSYLLGWDDKNVPMQTKFGDNIKSRRILLGLTQSELAEKMGYSDKSMIAKIESGKVDLQQSKIIAFAKVLETTPSLLMGWAEDDAEYLGREVHMGIGARLSILLEQKGVSARELALKVDVTPSTIYSIIQRNSNRMDVDLLLDIAHELGMTVDEFLGISRNGISEHDNILLTNYHKLNQKGQDYIDDQMAFALSQSKFTEGTTKKEA